MKNFNFLLILIPLFFFSCGQSSETNTKNLESTDTTINKAKNSNKKKKKSGTGYYDALKTELGISGAKIKQIRRINRNCSLRNKKLNRQSNPTDKVAANNIECGLKIKNILGTVTYNKKLEFDKIWNKKNKK